MLDELRECDPSSRIHVEVVLVLNVLLVHGIRLDPVRAVPPREQLDKVVLELGAEVGDVLAGVLADDKHLAQVRLRLGVALETVLVTALFLADLAVPPQPLKSLGLHLVGDVLRSTDCRLSEFYI